MLTGSLASVASLRQTSLGWISSLHRLPDSGESYLNSRSSIWLTSKTEHICTSKIFFVRIELYTAGENYIVDGQ